MSESFEGKDGVMGKLSEGEREQLRNFFNSLEGKRKIATIFQKLPEEVTEDEAVLAYEKLGVILFSREERLEDMTEKQREEEEDKWSELTEEPATKILKMPKDRGEPPFQKAA